LRLQTPLPEFAIEESEIAGALRAIEPLVEPPDALASRQHAGVNR
jgi:hypothetical protein